MKIYNETQVQEVVQALNNKEVVAIPTDTVFGFASILDDAAIQKLYDVKNRNNNPIAILAYDLESIQQVAKLTPNDELIIKKLMPGALTLIVYKKDTISNLLTNDLPTVGIRIPNHKLTLSILKECKVLAVTSANISGNPPHLSHQSIMKEFEGKINGVVCGNVYVKEASTVLDTTNDYKVLRNGAITLEQIISCISQGAD